MGMDMSVPTVLAMVLVALLLFAALGAATYAVVRAIGRGPGSERQAAGELLEERLARGEISPEEYFERESALRGGAPRTRHRRLRG